LNLQSIGLASAAAGLAFFFARGKLKARPLFILTSLLLVWDLGVFGVKLGAGFIGNAGEWKSLEPNAAAHRILRRAKEQPGVLLEIVREPSSELFYPNVAMMYNLYHAGGYSPLLLSSYYERVKELRIADSSLGRAVQSEEVWKSKREVLDGSGVRYLRTDFPLEWPGLELVDSAKNFFVYENKQVAGPVKIEEATPASGAKSSFHMVPGSTGDDLIMHFDMESEGTVTMRFAAYPGWKLWVDGQRTHWKTVDDFFLGFDLKKGDHEVRLFYRPSGWERSVWISLFGVAAAAAGFFLLRRPA
jgi:hypothetical protein